MKKNAQGFTHIEVIAVIVIVGLISAAGWLVYARQNDTADTKNDAQTNAKATSEKPATDSKEEEITFEKVSFANEKVTFNLPSNWKVGDESKQCGLSGDAADPQYLPLPTCVANLNVYPSKEDDSIQERIQYAGKITYVTSHQASAKDMLAGMLGGLGLCEGNDAQPFKNDANYEAVECTTSKGTEFEGRVSMLRSRNNFLYLSVDSKIAGANRFENGVEKRLPVIDLSEYTPSFEAIAKSIRFQ